MLQNKTDNLEKGRKLILQLTEQNNVKEQNGQGLGTKQNVMDENRECYGRKQRMLWTNMENVTEEYGQC